MGSTQSGCNLLRTSKGVTGLFTAQKVMLLGVFALLRNSEEDVNEEADADRRGATSRQELTIPTKTELHEGLMCTSIDGVHYVSAIHSRKVSSTWDNRLVVSKIERKSIIY